MDVSMHVLSTAKEHLKCSACLKYLSYFPIHTICENINICGRCDSPDEGIRNEIFEHLAGSIKFPCINDTKGCIEYNFPENVPEHEKCCKFRCIECPCIVGSDKCNWKGLVGEIYNHFQEKHITCILNHSRFEVSFISNSTNHYLLPYFEEFFLICLKNNVADGLCEFSINYLGHNPFSDKFKCRLTFENVNKMERKEFVTDVSKFSTYKAKEIMDALKEPVAIIILLDVFKEQDHLIEKLAENSDEFDQFLQELECPVCFLHMIPPIIQCETGHSLCKACTDQLSECPTCKKSFKKTQNFALEKISKLIMYPCKNSECNFKGKSNVIRQHENICKFSDIQCPLLEYHVTTCKWKAPLKKMLEHLTSQHQESLIELEQIVMPFNHEDIEDAFILHFNFQLFLLHFKYDSESTTFFWSLQMLGSSGDEYQVYKYDVDILDCTGSKRRFYFTGCCGEVTEKSRAFTVDGLYAHVHYYQIQDLITDQFGFRISIFFA